LQRERLFRRRLQPSPDFFVRRQDDRHCLGMDRCDDDVGLRRQEGEDFVFLLVLFHLPHGFPTRSNAGEKGERPAFIEGEPNWRARAIRQDFVFRERREGNHTTALDAEPSPPMRPRHVANVGDAGIAVAALQREDGRGRAQARRRKLADAIRRIADDWRGIVGKHARKQRQIARRVTHGPRKVADCLLALREGVGLHMVARVGRRPASVYAGPRRLARL